MQRLSCLFFCIFTLSAFGITLSKKNDNVLDRIKAGLQHATNYLETAKDIADLVSKSLGRKQEEQRENDNGPKPQQNFGPSNIMSAFFRLLGLDYQKVTAIAVNSVIFLAQMISQLFELKPPKENISRNFDDDDNKAQWDPMKFILENKNERIQNLIKQAQDHDLPNQLIDRVDGFDSACIRLLLCKASPVIRAAQKSLKNRTEANHHRMTSWLPDREEFEMNSDECEGKHNDCSLFPEP